jgi:hypothetical protein
MKDQQQHSLPRIRTSSFMKTKLHRHSPSICRRSVEEGSREGREEWENFANSGWRGGRSSRYCKALLFKKFGSKNRAVLYGCETWYFTLRKDKV